MKYIVLFLSILALDAKEPVLELTKVGNLSVLKWKENSYNLYSTTDFNSFLKIENFSREKGLNVYTNLDSMDRQFWFLKKK